MLKVVAPMTTEKLDRALEKLGRFAAALPKPPPRVCGSCRHWGRTGVAYGLCTNAASRFGECGAEAPACSLWGPE